MGYFNFYILKEFYKRNKKLFYKLILFITIFFIVSIIKNKCYGFSYNGSNYVDIKQNNDTYRIVTDRPFVVIPGLFNTNTINILNAYSGQPVSVSVFKNGTDYYGSQISGAHILTGDIVLNSSNNSTITNHKGYCIVFRYDNSIHNYIEYADYSTPTIINSTVPTWSFTNLQIVLGSGIMPYPHTERWDFTLNVKHNGTLYNYNVNDNLSSVTYYDGSSAYDIVGYGKIAIIRYDLLSNAILRNNDIVEFNLKTDFTYNNNGTITDYYNLGTYTLNITNDNDTMAGLQTVNDNIQNVNNNVQETTEAVEDNTRAIEHLEDTITDDTVESSADDLPSIDVGDPSQDGIDNIFQSIYNAFCVGQAQDIIFPIPFTNKNITLNPYYVRDMLNNNGASWVYTLIQVFWGYLIGRYIVSDISKKITKIKSGNIENIENENIKEEML